MALIMERAVAVTERASAELVLPVAVVMAAVLLAVGWLIGSVVGALVLAGLLVVGTVIAGLEHRALRFGELVGLFGLHLVALIAI